MPRKGTYHLRTCPRSVRLHANRPYARPNKTLITDKLPQSLWSIASSAAETADLVHHPLRARADISAARWAAVKCIMTTASVAQNAAASRFHSPVLSLTASSHSADIYEAIPDWNYVCNRPSIDPLVKLITWVLKVNGMLFRAWVSTSSFINLQSAKALLNYKLLYITVHSILTLHAVCFIYQPCFIYFHVILNYVKIVTCELTDTYLFTLLLTYHVVA